MLKRKRKKYTVVKIQTSDTSLIRLAVEPNCKKGCNVLNKKIEGYENNKSKN